MPVILPPEKYEQWLDPKFSDKEALQALLVPYPGAEMKSYQVDPIVNNARNESPQCVETPQETFLL